MRITVEKSKANSIRNKPPTQVKKQCYINFCQSCTRVFEIRSRAYSSQKYCSSSCYSTGIRKNSCLDCGVKCKTKRCSSCNTKHWHATKGSEWGKNRRASNLNHKMSLIVRNRIKSALKTQLSRKNVKYVSVAKNEALLGCSIEFLKAHLESKFQPGMSWDNWSHKGWHVDHIVPISAFDLTDEAQLKQACHYTNLQPLWAKDNLKKHAKIGTQ